MPATEQSSREPFEFRNNRRNKRDPAQPPVPAHQSVAPTPASVAPRIRQKQARPPLEKRTSHVHHGVAINPRVVRLASDLGFDLNEVSAAALTPERTWPSLSGDSTVHLRGALAVVVDDTTDEIVGLADRARALRTRTQPRHGAVKKTHGGSGVRFPGDTSELLRRASAAGLVMVEDRDHYVLRCPDRPGQVVAARNPSDHHAIPNTVMEIRRRFGVDLRKGVAENHA